MEEGTNQQNARNLEIRQPNARFAQENTLLTIKDAPSIETYKTQEENLETQDNRHKTTSNHKTINL